MDCYLARVRPKPRNRRLIVSSSRYTMGTVLVTGATTPLGNHLVPQLHKRGYTVRGLVDATERAPALADVPMQRLEGTIADDDVVADGIRGCDLVIHLASVGPGSGKGNEQLWRANTLCTKRLARAAREAGVGRFLHASSVITVGASRRARILDEDSEYTLDRYRLHYAKSRRAGELAVLGEVERGLDVVVVNPGAILGPDSRVLQAAANIRLSFFPPGGVNVVDVRDVAEGCLQALDHGKTGQRYILGGENVTGRDLVTTMLHASQRNPPRWAMPATLARWMATAARAVEAVAPMSPATASEMLRMFPLFFWFSSKKAEDELGFSATRTLEDMVGLDRPAADDQAGDVDLAPVAAEKSPSRV